MNRRAWKALLLATMTVMLCVLIISGATFALFTDSVTATNHLEAGKLDVTLTRTKLEWVSVNSEGYLEDHVDNTPKDLSTPTTTNLFGLTGDSLIAPLSYYKATLKIENKGTVAFTYGIKIKLNSTPNELAKQLYVTVKDNSGTTLSQGYLTDFATEKAITIATTQELNNTTNASDLFTVKVEFIDDGRPVGVSPTKPVNESFINNNAMSLSADFDLIVSATQVPTIQ